MQQSIKFRTSFLKNVKKQAIMNKINPFLGTGIVVVLVISLFSVSYSEEQTSQTKIIPIDNTIAIEKTTLNMSIPEINDYPWGFVQGKINNPVSDYPVIIQIYDNDDQILGNEVGAVHFAQTNVNDDGYYEHKFRVKSVDGDTITNIFEGDYTVVIFKVVYLYPDPDST